MRVLEGERVHQQMECPKHNALYVLFVDLKKVYDSVPRSSL